jgi:hypothetical protein
MRSAHDTVVGYAISCCMLICGQTHELRGPSEAQVITSSASRKPKKSPVVLAGSPKITRSASRKPKKSPVVLAGSLSAKLHELAPLSHETPAWGIRANVGTTLISAQLLCAPRSFMWFPPQNQARQAALTSRGQQTLLLFNVPSRVWRPFGAL